MLFFSQNSSSKYQNLLPPSKPLFSLFSIQNFIKIIIISNIFIICNSLHSQYSIFETLNSQNELTSVSMDHNQSYVIATTLNNAIQIWRIKNTKSQNIPYQTIKPKGNIYSLSIKQGSTMAIGLNVSNETGNYYKIQLWSVFENYFLLETYIEEQYEQTNSSLVKIQMSNDHSTIIGGINNNIIVMYKNHTCSQKYLITQILSNHQLNIICLDISGHKQIIISSSYDHTIRIWKLEGQYYIQHQIINIKTLIQNLSINNDSSMIVGSSQDNSVIVWILNNEGYYQIYQTLVGHQNQIIFVTVNSVKNVIITATSDQVKIWRKDLIGRYQDSQTIEYIGNITSIHVSKSKQRLLVANDNKIDIYNQISIDQCKNSIRINGHCYPILLVIFISIGIILILLLLIRQYLKKEVKKPQKDKKQIKLIDESINQSLLETEILYYD